MALKRVAIPSPNYSGRGGSSVRLIVLHTAEGARTYQDLGHYFQGPVGVSSHVGIDDTPGTIGEYVRRDYKAWTASNANPVAVQAELCAFASWGWDEWNTHSQMLDNTAKWIAEEAAKFNIPIDKLTSSQAQSSGIGVCQHVDLGTWGGNHWDCGSQFPIDDVLDMARGSDSGGSTPPPSAPPSSDAPPWNYPQDNYFGPPDKSNNWHDGHGGGFDNSQIRMWQNQMQHRGWTIDVDGIYGPQSMAVCKQFQAEKGLHVDGLCGPKTWAKAWEAPIT